MTQSSYEKLGRALSVAYPEIFKSILDTMQPELNDLSLIPKMYDHFCVDHNPKNEFNDKITFVSSVLKLYSPSSLFLNSRVTVGVCTILINQMGYNHKQSVSKLVGQCRVYIKNPKFRENIERVSSQLKEVA